MGGKSLQRVLHKRAYDCWVNMRQRCFNPVHPSWEHYGGRGIVICPEWNDFKVFLSDMGEPAEGLTLERLDNNKGYSKDNCAWKTMAEQCANKREQKTRHDNRTGVKGVGQRSNGYFIARTDQKHGTKLLYAGYNLEEAIEARRRWEASLN